MSNVLTGIIVLIIALIAVISINTSGFVNYVAPYAKKSQKNWYKRAGWERFGYPSYSYWSEGYENLNDIPTKIADDRVIMEFPPDTPGPASLYNNQPYHLLADELSPPRAKESISCVNSRSCYATDFERTISKTGNFRQFTNNYKRGYPDSCSAPHQELVLNFYKADPIAVGKNSTGGSVSELGFVN